MDGASFSINIFSAVDGDGMTTLLSLMFVCLFAFSKCAESVLAPLLLLPSAFFSIQEAQKSTLVFDRKELSAWKESSLFW